jgi:glucosamine-6-phosphate deaminase
LAAVAAHQSAQLIRNAIEARGTARIMIATGNSQVEFITALTREAHIHWPSVAVFHLDEYVGISAAHPASFRRWIRTRVADVVQPRSVSYIDGDAPDLEAEMERYSALLKAAPIDLALIGFGENGHIAFNDPPVADFRDPRTLRKVLLDGPCRAQQAGEGHFADIAAVPCEALTVTCSGLFRASSWVCVVPDRRKAQAVKDALEGPIAETCPASLVRTHPSACVYLDQESAALLSAGFFSIES